jgi:hypothetical protein
MTVGQQGELATCSPSKLFSQFPLKVRPSSLAAAFHPVPPRSADQQHIMKKITLSLFCSHYSHYLQSRSISMTLLDRRKN